MGSRTVKKKSKRQKGLRKFTSNRLLQDKDARNLLFIDSKFELLKKKTIFIRCKITISFLEKSRLEKNTHFLSLIPFSPSEISSQPMELVLKINPKKLGYYSVYPSYFIFSRVILEKTEQKKTIWGNYSVLGFAKSCSSSTSTINGLW